MRAQLLAWLLALVAVGLLAAESVIVVDEGQVAVRQRFGEPRGEPLGPGLHVGWPFEHVVYLDTRVATRLVQGEALVTGEQQALVADLAIDWRVQDPLRFLSTTGADEDRAAGQLADLLRSALKASWASQPLASLLAAPGGGIDDALRARLAEKGAALGLRVLDARLVRLAPTEQVAAAIGARMQAGFEAQVRALQSAADGEVARIRAEAERNRAQLLAGANRESQRVRGAGDAEAAAIYARSFGRNPEFAAFWRSLAAYRTALGREGDVLVVQPDGDFYKYLRSPARR